MEGRGEDPDCDSEAVGNMAPCTKGYQRKLGKRPRDKLYVMQRMSFMWTTITGEDPVVRLTKVK